MISGFVVGLLLVASILSLAALGIAVFSVVEVLAFKRSTHRIEYIPSPTEKDLMKWSEDDKKMEAAMAEGMLGGKYQQPPMQNEVI